MEIEDIQAFVAVADAGGLTPAAGRLGVSKSIVSRRIARLEKSLRTILLTRTTRGAALTEAGATFREHAARIAAEADAARDALSPDGKVRGRLRIAAPLSFGPTHFAPVFAELASRHPDLEVQTSYSDHFVDLVTEGFDAAIRLGALRDSSLVARRIASFSGRLVASPAYLLKHGTPRTPGELAAHAAVNRINDEWPLLHEGNPITVHPRARFTADNGAALVPAVLAGLGIALLPDFLIDEHLASGALVVVMRDFPMPEAGVYVVRPPGGVASCKVRVLIDIMVEKFGTTPVASPRVSRADRGAP
ncbi:MAG TPA: LysR family transcriptional regulator [Steroidobacteraceae bacterium]|jgi:DNA-binding transcriptional LysR family regulator|nr:LysR family transcriptional regulator [Steroidobacteraceae bacterium]